MRRKRSPEVTWQSSSSPASCWFWYWWLLCSSSDTRAPRAHPLTSLPVVMRSWALVGVTEVAADMEATALLQLRRTVAAALPLSVASRRLSWLTSANVTQRVRTMMMTMKMRTLFTWVRMAPCTGSSVMDSWERTRTSWSMMMRATPSGEIEFL